ncbi:unnamed protein product [Trifolium pratense]|uniref:Uncharacterized protein n=1 Tax=Trifolium pratense TaxID=57577 RepID=A0ACB0KZ97_TRIPR|nr:unnamed protein product [Trifolium pratense]
MAAAEDIHGEAIEKLKQIQDELEKINEKELLEIKQKHNEMSKLLYDKRNNVIESIPDFWKTAFLGHTDLRNPVMHGYSVFERVPVPAICWAISTAHQVATTIAFRSGLPGQSLSAQCIINELPKHAREDEILVRREHLTGPPFYDSSTYMALQFIIEEGIATELAYPLVGNLPLVGWYVAEDRDREFQPVTICWAISTAHQVATTIAFRSGLPGQSLSAQCIINGLPKHAREDEILVRREHLTGPPFYDSSTYMALQFIIEEGIATELAYPLVGNLPLVGWYVAEDRDREFQPIVAMIKDYLWPNPLTYFKYFYNLTKKKLKDHEDEEDVVIN